MRFGKLSLLGEAPLRDVVGADDLDAAVVDQMDALVLVDVAQAGSRRSSRPMLTMKFEVLRPFQRPTAHVDKLAAPIRVANSPRSRANRGSQIRLPLAREVNGSAARSSSAAESGGLESGQTSRNACGV